MYLTKLNDLANKVMHHITWNSKPNTNIAATRT
ncbi:hypothetical protein BPTFM16_02765 [Altererythrobacter insulae]|nr:hypothetical protein BPTFM16_02765 [Altererythrobacter insulae]